MDAAAALARSPAAAYRQRVGDRTDAATAETLQRHERRSRRARSASLPPLAPPTAHSAATLLGFCLLAASVLALPWVLGVLSPVVAPPPGAAPAPEAGTTLVTGTRAAVAADDGVCSAAALAVMEEGVVESGGKTLPFSRAASTGGESKDQAAGGQPKGNAVDAAVVAVLCQGVLGGYAGGVGGGAVLVVRVNGTSEEKGGGDATTAAAAVSGANATASSVRTAKSGATTTRASATPSRTVVYEGLCAAPTAVDNSALDGAPGVNASAAGVLVGVPGAVAALAAAHAAHGRLPWAALVGVAAGLADGSSVSPMLGAVLAATATATAGGGGGVTASPSLAAIFTRPTLSKKQEAAASIGTRRFTPTVPGAVASSHAANVSADSEDDTPGRVVLSAGEKLRQPALAATLRQLAANPAALYEDTPLRTAFLADVAAAGGTLSAADMAAYTASTSPPLTFPYRGLTVETAPPPVSGGLAVGAALTILDGVPGVGGTHNDARQRVVEATKYGLGLRAVVGTADGGTATAAATAAVSDPAWATARRRRLDSRRTHGGRTYTPGGRHQTVDAGEELRARAAAATAAAVAAGAEPSARSRRHNAGGAFAAEDHPATAAAATHVSVLDADGTIVVATATHHGPPWGATAASAATGIVLNAAVGSFARRLPAPAPPPAAANALTPRSRPATPASPVVLSRGTAGLAGLGSGGGGGGP
ncbi:hypothetical protein MMPV_005107 [Pyropia vietnamensis]